MARLGLNVDHVATLRQARGGKEPSPSTAAVMAELAGADGIVVHLREDRRHIQERDVFFLRETIRVPLDLEMSATDAMIRFALEVKPALVTLVPEKRQELTTEGGLNVVGQVGDIKKAIDRLHEGGIPVSLFIDPDPNQIKVAHKIGTDVIEIHTGGYANSRGKNRQTELHHVEEAAKLIAKLGIGVNAGHGIDYQNIAPLARIAEIEEFNIGHSILSRAVFVGITEAVREMKRKMGG
jgi:pyridoxine 5-phosphate synthase